MEVPEGSADRTELVQPRGGGGSDGSKPAVRQRAAQCVSRSARLANGLGRIQAFRFAVASSSNIEFRAEFFNFFNRTNFRAPTGNSVNRSNAAFGTITATYDPRIIQFGLKANF